MNLLNHILKLGNPLLYQKSALVKKEELSALKEQFDLLNQLILEFQKKYGAGRGIAAPQIGLMKRIVCLNINQKRHTLINPQLDNFSPDMMQLWDDCMCFPNLLVEVQRHQSCTLTFRDENWVEQTWELEGALSELLQHECDHLDGILATQRAIHNKAFKIKEV